MTSLSSPQVIVFHAMTSLIYCTIPMKFSSSAFSFFHHGRCPRHVRHSGKMKTICNHSSRSRLLKSFVKLEESISHPASSLALDLQWIRKPYHANDMLRTFCLLYHEHSSWLLHIRQMLRAWLIVFIISSAYFNVTTRPVNIPALHWEFMSIGVLICF